MKTRNDLFVALSVFIVVGLSGCGATNISKKTAESEERPVSGGVPDDGLPDVIRLDQQLDRILSGNSSKNARRKFLELEIRQHQGVYAKLGHGDPAAYAQILVDGDNEFARANRKTKSLFAERDLTNEIKDIYRDMMRKLEFETATPPEVFLVYGFERGTNARTEFKGQGSQGQIFLNLNALVKPAHFETAVRHELIHFIQPEFGATLLEISMKEGVASWLSFVTRADMKKNDRPAIAPWHQCLFWSQDEFVTADRMKTELIREFAKSRDKSDQRTIQQFLYLDVNPGSLPDAPCRTGYFIGLMAVQAWAAQNPEMSEADILDVTPQELWKALLNQHL